MAVARRVRFKVLLPCRSDGLHYAAAAPALRVLPGPRRRADATIVSRMTDTGQTDRARHEPPVSDPPRMPAGRLRDRDRLLADPAADIRVLRLTKEEESA